MKLLKVKRVISAAMGELPLKVSGTTFKPQGFTRETQAGEVPESTGFIETTTAAELKVKLNASMVSDVRIDEFTNISSDTLTIYLDGEGIYTMPNAWVTEPPELGEGEFDVTYNSAKSEKLS